MPIIPYLAYCFYRFLSSLWRIQVVEVPAARKLMDQKVPLIMAHWHGDEIALLHMVRSLHLATMTSTSKDGSLIDFIVQRLGGVTSRGSSTRGGVSALIGLIRLCRSGRITSVAVDGPRGPIYQPKPGIFELSKLCNAIIIPVGVATTSAHVFERSWNKTYLPYPFAKVSIFFGEPLPALTSDDDPRNLNFSKALALAIDGAKQQAAKIIAAR